MKSGIKVEMIVAISALSISMVTALISIYSAYIDRSYARASVWPRLEISRSFSGDIFEYVVTNPGNGPALIQYGVVKYDSNHIKYWRDIPDLPSFIQSHISTRALPPQSTVKPLSYTGEETEKFLAMDTSLNITLCYCSIYDECWLVDSGNEPTSVSSCLISANKKFLQ